MPLRYRAWHLVPLSLPVGLLLVLIGASGAHAWLIVAGIVLLSVSVVDTAIVFPLVMVRNSRRRDPGW